jgi:hypothetical protein
MGMKMGIDHRVLAGQFSEIGSFKQDPVGILLIHMSLTIIKSGFMIVVQEAAFSVLWIN